VVKLFEQAKPLMLSDLKAVLDRIGFAPETHLVVKFRDDNGFEASRQVASISSSSTSTLTASGGGENASFFFELTLL
jgi:hypothetical protein